MIYPPRMLSCCLLLALLSALSASAVTLSPGDSIQAAISAAADGDAIVLSPGVYNERLDFLGKGIVIRSTDPLNPSVVATTIIDGGGAGRVVTFEMGETSAAQLKGLTIRNGGGPGVIGGGGIFCHNASPKITNNLIVGNLLAAGSGGGILVNGGAPTIVQNVIRGNSSPVAGGGICYQNSAAGLFQENSLMQNTGSDGGGLAIFSSTPDVRKNGIQKNTAASSGGGIYLYNADAQLRYNSIHRNSASSGAAIYASGSAWRLANCLVTNNTSAFGGAVEASGGTISLTSNTLVANSCGVYTSDSGGTITNCIITDSTGVGVMSVGTTRPTMSYTDLWANAGGNYGGVATAKGLLTVDPLYVAPADGIYTLKSKAGHWVGVWVPDAATSPCVDAGSPWLTCALEPAPNGGRINMGVEGNTEQASKSIESLVSSISPAAGAEDVSRRPQIVVTFQRLVDQASAESHFDLYSGPTNPAGTFSWVIPNRRMIFTPVLLGAGAPWHITLTSGVKLWDGTTTALPFSSSFMSSNRPAVLTGAPAGEGVALGTNIVVNFDAPMAHGITERAFVINPAAPGVFRWANASQRLIFNPNAPLAAGTIYRVTIKNSARSAAGVAMNWAYSWTFNTVSPPAPPLRLQAAAAGGSAITATLNAPAAVQATICNLAGRTVAELPAQQCPAGVTTLLWDGRSTGGTLAPRGTYLVRLVARAADGAQSSCLVTMAR